MGNNLSESTVVAENLRIPRMCMMSTQSNEHFPSFHLLANEMTSMQLAFE